MLGDGETLDALLGQIRVIVREEVRAVHPVRYSYDEAAQRIGISLGTLRAHVAAGDIPPLRIGARVLFTEEMIEMFERDAAAGRLRYKSRKRGRKPGQRAAAR